MTKRTVKIDVPVGRAEALLLGFACFANGITAKQFSALSGEEQRLMVERYTDLDGDGLKRALRYLCRLGVTGVTPC